MNGTQYPFGEIVISLIQGAKKENDYCVLWDGTQFRDISLFTILSNNIKTEKGAKLFIKRILEYPKIKFDKRQIIIQGTSDDFYKYCSNLSEVKELQKATLFSILLRLDIDNICYPYPFNGAIRHFIQILMLLGYTFNWEDFKSRKINISGEKITEVINNIGFPTNRFKFNTDDFFEIYDKWLRVKDSFL